MKFFKGLLYSLYEFIFSYTFYITIAMVILFLTIPQMGVVYFLYVLLLTMLIISQNITISIGYEKSPSRVYGCNYLYYSMHKDYEHIIINNRILIYSIRYSNKVLIYKGRRYSKVDYYNGDIGTIIDCLRREINNVNENKSKNKKTLKEKWFDKNIKVDL